jgi:hypothetical protein
MYVCIYASLAQILCKAVVHKSKADAVNEADVGKKNWGFSLLLGGECGIWSRMYCVEVSNERKNESCSLRGLILLILGAPSQG